MRRDVLPLVGPGCALVLLAIVYRGVLFGGEQFAFRDAGHFYYPLYLRVQQEWEAGRWPLWNAWQNGGQPLLGSPMAAVLYPGKLVFALFSYAWGIRVYTVAHTLLAFAGMRALARSLGVGPVGAAIGGLSYAFGAPVLFQYCNIIYLVGAAWVPWGLRAVERLVRQRRPATVAELASILAMLVLGGDPQAAYLTVLCGAGYALVLERPERGFAPRLVPWLMPAVAGAWLVAVPLLASFRVAIPGRSASMWLPSLVAWAVVAGWVVWRRRRRADGGLAARLGVLAGAGLLALLLAAAQLFPTVEFLGAGSRTADRLPTTRTRFSVEPYRLVELAWPWSFGHPYPENRSWVQVIPPVGERELWEPSLYVGGLALVLGLGAAGFRGGPPWRSWLTTIGLVALAASFGKFGGPLWWLRWVPGLASVLGPHDPIAGAPRTDDCWLDAAGSPFDLFSALVPGFGLFRYPAKLLTFSAIAISALAGLGWDEVAEGRSTRFVRGCRFGVVAGAVGLSLTFLLQGPLLALLGSRPPTQVDLGPADIPAAWVETRRALAHGLVVYAAGLALAPWAVRRPRQAGVIALVVLAADLGLANCRLIWTVPQAAFDAMPEAARQIAEAERADPSPGPFRVHRMPGWHPSRFVGPATPGRDVELFAWDRGTLTPLNGLPYDLEYSWTKGVIEHDDFFAFLMPQIVHASVEAAARLKLQPGDPVYYYPRRNYDLMGSRYFILPVRTLRWRTEERGFAAFLTDTEVIYPKFEDRGADALRQWTQESDWQILRNTAAYPRAWLVHSARVLAPVSDPSTRRELTQDIAYQNDLFWSDPGVPVHDPRFMAWIETIDRDALRGYLAHAPVEPGESVTVTRSEPQRIELTARLKRPGIVILAESFYPGWYLTIDGRPAPILRTNRVMRGAAVREGEHTLVYLYDPPTFRLGLAVTPLALLVLAGLVARQIWADREQAGKD